MASLSSTYPYSMDSLVSKRSLDEFWRDSIMPFVLYGLGSVTDALNLKIWELRETLTAANDREWQKSFMALHGLQTK